MTFPECLNNLLYSITPSDDERARVDEIARRILGTMKRLAEPYSDIIRHVGFEGSYAKDTWLSGEYDLDLFLYFSPESSLETLKTVTRDIVYSAASLLDARVEARYAAHPYYTLILVDGVEVDVVPAYYVNHYSEVKTPVDRTRLHTHYVKSALEKNPSLKSDIRLLKKLLKIYYLYGAEIEVQGFSGYLCEILTIHYGGLLEFLGAAARWRPWKTVIPPSAVPDTRAPLVVVDPVDPRRNAAAAVSLEALHQLIGMARVASESPERVCCVFSPHSYVDAKPVVDRHVRRYIVEILFRDGRARPREERAGIAQRQRRRILKAAEKAGFTVLRSRVFLCNDAALIIFEVFPPSLPPKELHRGPPVYSENTAPFLEKWSRKLAPISLVGGRWTVLIERRVKRFPDVAGTVLSLDRRFTWRIRSERYVAENCPQAYKWLEEGYSWIYCAAMKKKS